MEILPLLRLAWRRRVALGLGFALAIAVGLLAVRGAETRAGSASTRLVIDTPVSQLVEAAPSGAESLGWRTELLAYLMTSRPARQQIARAVGVGAQQLAVVSPALDTPVLPTSLPRRAAAVAASTSAPYVLTVLADGALPIISLDASAPSGAAAARLLAAGAATLKSAAAIAPDTPGTQPLVVQDAGSMQATETSSGARRKRAAAAFLAVLCLWCAGVLLVPAALTRARRATRRARIA